MMGCSVTGCTFWGRRGEVRAGPRLDKRERERGAMFSHKKKINKSGKITLVGDLIN